MKDNSAMFILVGNGPYSNRGCEAIIRGTVNILQHWFASPEFLVYSLFHDHAGLSEQRNREKDPAITHDEIWGSHNRFDTAWFLTNILRRTVPNTLRHLFYKNLKTHLPDTKAVLAVGGDNYSLDYGRRPILCTELDDLVTSIGKPLVIWGASIGPFTKDAAYEKYIMEHFRKVHIFARESLTIDYLNRNGLVGNVHKTADPAFMMEPRKPCSGTMEIPPDNGAIGINISPLMARYTPDRNLDTWVGMSAGIVEAIIRKTKRDIYLIPHVSSSNGRNNDHTFLCKVAFLLGRKKARVFVVPDTLDASETKWVISKMDLFVGARMHSTIASFSSYVPTLSLGYSVKSWGINRDIYGHTEYCLDIGTLTPDVVADKVSEMLSDSRSIEDLLKATIPRIKEYALSAGSILGKILHM